MQTPRIAKGSHPAVELSTCTVEGSAPAEVCCRGTAALQSQQTSVLTPGTLAAVAAEPSNSPVAVAVAVGGTRTSRAVVGLRYMQFAPLVCT